MRLTCSVCTIFFMLFAVSAQAADLDIWSVLRSNQSSPWGTPQVLGTAINSAYNENNPEFSSDGLTLLFDSNRPGGRGKTDIYYSTRPDVSSGWAQAQNLSPYINTNNNEGGASLSSDGLILFFHSIRSGGQGGWDIWYSMRSSVGDQWGSPVNAGSGINSGGDDWTPEISLIDNSLYFSSYRNNAWDVYAADILNLDSVGATITFGSAQALGLGNAVAPDISQDGLSLYYESVIANDILLATRASTGSAWAPGTVLTLGSSQAEAPSISADERALYYVSIPEPGTWLLLVTVTFGIWKRRRRA